MLEETKMHLPAVHRVVTGHDAEGVATIRLEDRDSPIPLPGIGMGFLQIWSTAQVPADNADKLDGRLRDNGFGLASGSVIRIVDFVPGAATPFHRTQSIDYGVVLSGQIELEMEDGSRRDVAAGGVIIQQGTNHLWRNRGDAPCRILFVMIEALPWIAECSAA